VSELLNFFGVITEVHVYSFCKLGVFSEHGFGEEYVLFQDDTKVQEQLHNYYLSNSFINL